MSTVVKKTTGRSWLSAIALILAVALTPAAIVTHWTTSEVTNTQRFVATMSPLASNPAVQDAIIAEVTALVDEKINVQGVTESLFSGLGTSLNLPDAAMKALELLAAPAAGGIEDLIHTRISDAVRSKAFATAWTRTLTLTQEQTIALLKGDPNSALKLSNDGTLTLPLKPLIAEIKKELIAQGVTFASVIPETDKSITIAKIPELALARVLYQIGVGVGTWLPWIVVALLAVGIAAARRRPRALAATASVMLGVMLLMAFIFSSGRIVATTVIEPSYSAVVGAVYDALVAFVLNVVVALGILSVVAIVTGWAFGESDSAAKLRAFANNQIVAVRKVIDPEDKYFAQSSVVMHQYRVVARVGIIAGIGLILSSTVPLTASDVISMTVLALALLFAYEVLQRPVASAAVKATPDVVATSTVAKKAPARKAPVSKTPARKAPVKTGATAPTKPVAKKTTTKKS